MLFLPFLLCPVRLRRSTSALLVNPSIWKSGMLMVYKLAAWDIFMDQYSPLLNYVPCKSTGFLACVSSFCLSKLTLMTFRDS